MSYTFGGGTGDDIVVTALPVAIGASPSNSITAGWFYPTTLTAGRFYWSCANTIGMGVDTTTDELRIYTDNTTDGEYNTTGADVVVNEWVFIATLMNVHSTGPAGAVRVWVGRANTPPIEVTVTQAVAPSGSFTGATTRYIGNRGTGTVAFQGDIGWMSFLASNNGTNILSPFGIAGTGTITDAEAANNYRKWIFPLWNGNPFPWMPCGYGTVNVSYLHVPLDNSGVAIHRGFEADYFTHQVPTVTGASFSTNTPPRRPRNDWVLQNQPQPRER